ncbi:MAG TPA: hypothetical protein VIN71_10740 [Pseudomonadales bacterium]
MYIHRGLLLVIMVIFIFSPAILDWITDNHAAWYRPFIAWLLVILLVWTAQWWSGRKDHHV